MTRSRRTASWLASSCDHVRSERRARHSLPRVLPVFARLRQGRVRRQGARRAVRGLRARSLRPLVGADAVRRRHVVDPDVL